MNQMKEAEFGRMSLDLLAKNFYNAVRDVIHTMTGFHVDEKEEGISDHPEFSDNISGFMVLNGDKLGIISITVSRNTAAQLLMYMTGIAASELSDEELYDGLAEMANMVAGSAKAQLSDTDYYFEISSPFVVAGKQYTIVHKSKVRRVKRQFSADDMDIFLEVYYV